MLLYFNIYVVLRAKLDTLCKGWLMPCVFFQKSAGYLLLFCFPDIHASVPGHRLTLTNHMIANNTLVIEELQML